MADEPQGNTQTSSNGTQTSSKGEVEPAWAKTLNENFGKLLTSVEALQAHSAEGLRRQATPPQEPVDDEEPASALDDPNLDLQPMSVVARKILDEVGGIVDRAIKPVTEKIGQTEVAAQTTALTQEATDFANRTPDFNQWQTEMVEVAKQYPNMRIADIYSLARVRNPTKVEELAKAAKKAKDDAEPKPPKKSAFSLTPSGQTGEIINENMSPSDAAKSAWEETVEKFGGSPFSSG